MKESISGNAHKFEAIFNYSSNSIFTIDLHARFIDTNQSLSILTGYSREELFQMSLESLFFLPNEIVKIHKSIEEMILKGTRNKPDEYLLKNKNGSTTWVLLEINPLYENGKLYAFIGIISDISKCKLSDPHFSDQKLLIQRVFDNHPGMIYLFNVDEKSAVYVNRTAAAMIGYSSGDIIGKGDHVLADLVHPEDLPQLEKHFDSLKKLHASEIRSTEYRVKDSEDKWRWMLAHHTPFLWNSDGSVHGVLGAVDEITQRKQWELILSKKEEDLRITLQSIGDGVITTDINGNIVQINIVAQRLTGWSFEDAIGKPLTDVFNIMNAENRIQIISPVMDVLITGNKIYLHDHIILTARDKKEYFIQDSVAPVKDTVGNTRGIVVIFSDISEKTRLQEQILADREWLKLAIESTDLGTLDWNIVTGKVEVNQRWAQMLGYTLEEIEKNTSIWELRNYPDDQPEINAKIKALLEGKTALFESEHRMITKSGALIWVLSKGRVIERNSEGQPIRYTGTQMDITARKQVELTLKFNAERDRTYMQETTDGIYRAETGIPIDTTLPVEKQLDLLYEHVYMDECNDAFARMYGFEHNYEMKGIKLFQIHGGKDNPQNVAFLTQFIKNNYRIENAVSMEFDRYHQVRYFSNNIFGIIQDNKIIRAWGTQRDITDLKKAEETQQQYAEELQKTNRELHEANESLKSLDTLKSDFISMAAHELRTPITSVLGFTQTLLAPDITLSHEEQSEYLGIIEKEALRLGKLINDLLDISKIESKRHEIKKESVSLFNLAWDIINTMEISPDKQIKISSDSFGKKEFICDKDRIRRVFINIIENAMRYGNKIDIQIHGADSERTVIISDNGPGIAPEYFSRIFEKFYRIKKGKIYGTGSGLGLAIAKDIVEAHGGRIWVESTLGKGAAFHFTIKSL